MVEFKDLTTEDKRIICELPKMRLKMKTPTFIKRLKYRSARNKLIPLLNTSNPIINDLVDLVLKYHYDYDTVYTVYTEWDNDIISTESTLITAVFMSVDPLDITQGSMKRFGEIIKMSLISMDDAADMLRGSK